MTLLLEPELGIPLPENTPYLNLRERAIAACESALVLHGYGFTAPEATTEDKDTAAALAIHTLNGNKVRDTTAPSARSSAPTPASMLLVGTILAEFSHSIAEDAAQIRNLVTNKLLLETENPDPRIRIRALELLGKVSDVGLFTEKSEVTVKNRSSEDIRSRLRNKLSKLTTYTTEGFEDGVIIEAQPVDVDAALGLDVEEPDVDVDADGPYDDEPAAP